MKEETQNIIHEVFTASQEGRIHFGQVISSLVSSGVESYQVDYRTGNTTYYLPSGEILATSQGSPEVEIGKGFDAEALKAAIRGSQQGKVKYPEFKRLSQTAGCVGYMVWLAGRHVTYFGRCGETHIEKFPD